MRQYIGARYVPKFYVNGSNTNDWTANTQYEALTIVTRNGNSYTSKKNVPSSVGAPEDNPEYWASTGIYNAQVQELRDDIDAVSDRVDALERTALYIGNSYCRGNLTGDEYHGIYYYSKHYFDESYMYWDDGIGFVPYTGHSDTFTTVLQSAWASGDFDPTEITDIIVLSAWGDTRAVAENISITSGIDSFCTFANGNFPNLKRISVALAECRPLIADYVVSTIHNPYINMFKVHQTLSRYQNTNYDYVGWIGYRELQNTGHFQADDVHLTNDGYKVLGDRLTSALDGVLTYSNAYEHIAFTIPLTAVFGGGYMTAVVDNTPDGGRMRIESVSWSSVPSTYTVPTRQDYHIAVPEIAQIYFNRGSQTPIQLNTSFQNGDHEMVMYLQPERYNDTPGLRIYPYADHLTGNKTTDGFSGFVGCYAEIT